MKTDVFKDAAINQCYKSAYKQRLGAVVVFKGRIVGKGFNKIIGNGSMRVGTVHAEVSALNNSPAAYRKGAVVYVSRITSKGELVMSKPCHACEVVLRKLGVKRVWYSEAGEWKRWVL